MKSLALSADHAGFELKEHLKKELDKRGIPYTDLGAEKNEPLDAYTEYAAKLARAVADGTFERGITLCGTGIGASIAANRFTGVRAALCGTPDMARMSRLHNDANVLVMGGRVTPADLAVKIMDQWLDTGFEGGRHQIRITQLDEIGK